MDGRPGALLPSPDLAARPVAGPCSGSGQQPRLRLDSDAHSLPPPPAPCMPPGNTHAGNLRIHGIDSATAVGSGSSGRVIAPSLMLYTPEPPMGLSGFLRPHWCTK
ncbi:hypothetical protein VPH35_006658 [Triticum aestivum]